MSLSTALQAGFNTIKNDKRGQSFIEAMIALTILVSAVSSSMALVQSSLTATRISGSQVVAANLAREGVEVVRSIRDSNWLRGQSFQVGLVSGTDKSSRPFLNLATGEWTMDFTALTIEDEDAVLYLYPNGLYIQANSQPVGTRHSPYQRIITLNHICRVDATGVEAIFTGATTCGVGETLVGLAVEVEVSLIGVSGSRRSVTVDERLYDWR